LQDEALTRTGILKSGNKDTESKDMTNFRRGKSKVFYASDIWDPGEEARTSFRSNCSDDDDDTFVASLLRRKSGTQLGKHERDETKLL
jgi:hypothetical protein